MGRDVISVATAVDLALGGTIEGQSALVERALGSGFPGCDHNQDRFVDRKVDGHEAFEFFFVVLDEDRIEGQTAERQPFF